MSIAVSLAGVTMGEARKLGDQSPAVAGVLEPAEAVYARPPPGDITSSTRSDPSDVDLDSRRQDRPAFSERYNSVKRFPAISIIGPVEQVSHKDPSAPLSVADGDEP